MKEKNKELLSSHPIALILNGEKIDGDIAKKNLEGLETKPSTKNLVLANNQIDDEGAKYIAETLQSSSSVVSLLLHDNQISDEGIKFITEALKVNESITHLEIKGNLSVQAAGYIADAMNFNSSINHLVLFRNQIGNEGVKALAEAIKANSSIICLTLNRNQIGDEGVKALAEAIKANSSITELRLLGNQIENEGAEHLAEALKTNFTIKKLDLCENYIGDVGANCFVQTLKTNSFIFELNLLNNEIGEELISLINNVTDKNLGNYNVLKKFLARNAEEFSKLYEGDINKLEVIDTTDCYKKGNNFSIPKTVYNFFELLHKIPYNFTEANLFMAGNFFATVCKKFVPGHMFDIIPKELIAKIAYGLPFPRFKIVQEQKTGNLNVVDVTDPDNPIELETTEDNDLLQATQLSFMNLEEVDALGAQNTHD